MKRKEYEKNPKGTREEHEKSFEKNKGKLREYKGNVKHV